MQSRFVPPFFRLLSCRKTTTKFPSNMCRICAVQSHSLHRVLYDLPASANNEYSSVHVPVSLCFFEEHLLKDVLRIRGIFQTQRTDPANGICIPLHRPIHFLFAPHCTLPCGHPPATSVGSPSAPAAAAARIVAHAVPVFVHEAGAAATVVAHAVPVLIHKAGAAATVVAHAVPVFIHESSVPATCGDSRNAAIFYAAAVCQRSARAQGQRHRACQQARRQSVFHDSILPLFHASPRGLLLYIRLRRVDPFIRPEKIRTKKKAHGGLLTRRTLHGKAGAAFAAPAIPLFTARPAHVRQNRR